MIYLAKSFLTVNIPLYYP